MRWGYVLAVVSSASVSACSIPTGGNHYPTVQISIRNNCDQPVTIGIGLSDSDALDSVASGGIAIDPGGYGGDIIPVTDSAAEEVSVAVSENPMSIAQILHFDLEALKAEPGRATLCP